MTTLSSSTMKSSAVNATSSAASISVRRLSLLPYVFWISSISSRTTLPAASSSLSSAADLARALALLGQLVLDDENLETREAIELQLEDRVGLLGVELEALHDLLRRVGLAVRLADDPDDLVERVEDLLEALEHVDALPAAPRARARGAWSRPPAGSAGSARGSPCRSRRSGRPTSSFSVGIRHVRLTMKLVWSGVFLNRYAITIFGSASFFSSSSIRTSSVDTSLTSSERRQLAREDDVGDALDERGLVDRVRECW